MKEQDNKNKKYLLNGGDEDQLKSAFQGSLAFRFYSEKIEGREERRFVSILLNQNLLPQHCKLELIENAFASLKNYPENAQLLKALGEYTKNSLFEKIFYVGMGGGISKVEYSLPSLPAIATAVICTIAAVTIFPSVFIIAAITSATLFTFNVASNGEPGLQFGRWIRDLVKGGSQEPANLSELENNLNIGINACKTSSEQILSSTVAPQESAAEQTSAQASNRVRDGFPYATASTTFYKPEPVEAKGPVNTSDNLSASIGYTA